MRGELTKIAPMAASLERWNPNSPKVYAVEISTDSSDARLRPGMTVDVEIYIETVEDALLLPVEAVYSREGKTVCRVLTPAGPVEREVETGRASTHFVEILGGVKAGAEVLLHRPEAEAEA
jgi:HlyD family secretion protein